MLISRTIINLQNDELHTLLFQPIIASIDATKKIQPHFDENVHLRLFSLFFFSCIFPIRIAMTDNTTDIAYQSIAKCYADANTKLPSSYWDYDALQVQWG